MAGLRKTGVELVAEGSDQFFAAMRNADKAVLDFGSAAERAGKGINSFGEIAVGALRRVGELATEAFVEAGKAAASFAADSVKAAGNFESGLNRLASVAGSSLGNAGISMDDLKKKALEMGAKTQFSAQEALDAMTELAKGGVAITDVMGGATDATLTLAAAGELDLANAAEIVAKQLGVWASTGVEAANVADLMAQAANASTVNVEELALGMANVGGIAKTTGLSFQETVQTLALLAPGFSSAADAGTSFKTFLTRLQPATKPAIKAMDELGLLTAEGTSKFYDATGSFIGMGKAAELLQGSLSGLSEAERTAALQAIFGQDAFRAAALLAEQGSEGFDAMGQSMNAAGSAAAQAAERQKGFNFAMESFKGSIETLQIVIGSALLPVLAELINTYLIPITNAFMALAQGDTFTFFTTLAGVIMPLNQGLGQFVASLALASDPLATLVQGINSVIPGFSAFVSFVQQIPAAVAPIVAALGGWENILIGIAAVVGGVVVAAIGAFLASIAPVVAGVAGVVVAIAAAKAAWESNFLGIQTVTTTVMNGIMALVSAILPQIAAFWSTHGAEIAAFAQQAWSQIQAIVTAALQIYATIIGSHLQAAAAFINTHGAEIQAVFSGVWQAIQGIIQVVLAVIQGVLQTTLAVMQGDWEGAWNAIQTMTGQVVDGILNIVKGNLKVLVTIFGAIIKDVLAVLSKAVGGFVQAGEDLVAGIAEGISNGLDWVVDAALSVVQAAIDAAWAALDNGSPSEVTKQEIGIPISQGIAEGITAEGGGITDAMIEQIVEMFKDVEPYVIDAAVEIGQPFVQSIIKGVIKESPTLFNELATTAEDMLDVFKEFGDKVQQTIQETLQGVAATARGMGSAISTILGSVNTDAAQRAADRVLKLQEALRAERRKTDPDRKRITELEQQLEAATEQQTIQDRIVGQQRILQEQAMDALRQAQEEAAGISDPRQRAQFLQLRQKQISELVSAQMALAEAEAAYAASGGTFEAGQAREAARQQLAFVQQAQAAETEAFRVGLLTAVDNSGEAIGAATAGAVLQALGPLPQALAETLRQSLESIRIEPRQHGGPVRSGSPYWVGEHGPELFMPRNSGVIQPAMSPALMGQLRTMNAQAQSISTTNNWTYAPTYGGPAPQPSQDIGIMRVLAGA